MIGTHSRIEAWSRNGEFSILPTLFSLFSEYVFTTKYWQEITAPPISQIIVFIMRSYVFLMMMKAAGSTVRRGLYELVDIYGKDTIIILVGSWCVKRVQPSNNWTHMTPGPNAWRDRNRRLSYWTHGADLFVFLVSSLLLVCFSTTCRNVCCYEGNIFVGCIAIIDLVVIVFANL